MLGVGRRGETARGSDKERLKGTAKLVAPPFPPLCVQSRVSREIRVSGGRSAHHIIHHPPHTRLRWLIHNDVSPHPRRACHGPSAGVGQTMCPHRRRAHTPHTAAQTHPPAPHTRAHGAVPASPASHAEVAQRQLHDRRVRAQQLAEVPEEVVVEDLGRLGVAQLRPVLRHVCGARRSSRTDVQARSGWRVDGRSRRTSAKQCMRVLKRSPPPTHTHTHTAVRHRIRALPAATAPRRPTHSRRTSPAPPAPSSGPRVCRRTAEAEAE